VTQPDAQVIGRLSQLREPRRREEDATSKSRQRE